MLLLIALPAMLLASPTATAKPHPICKNDLSKVPLNLRGRLMRPAHLEERALRPGVLHVQAEVCRCLPSRPRHQPDAVKAKLHIAPNKGEITVEYIIQSPEPDSRRMERMTDCLGHPTMAIEPIPYRSDMRDENGPIEEVFVYPVLLNLER